MFTNAASCQNICFGDSELLMPHFITKRLNYLKKRNIFFPRDLNHQLHWPHAPTHISSCWSIMFNFALFQIPLKDKQGVEESPASEIRHERMYAGVHSGHELNSCGLPQARQLLSSFTTRPLRRSRAVWNSSRLHKYGKCTSPLPFSYKMATIQWDKIINKLELSLRRFHRSRNCCRFISIYKHGITVPLYRFFCGYFMSNFI